MGEEYDCHDTSRREVVGMNGIRFRNLERFSRARTGNQFELSLPPPKSASGKVLRHCPNGECAPGVFMLGEAPDYRVVAADYPYAVPRRPGQPPTTCPYCGTTCASDEFRDPADVKAAKEYVKGLVSRDAAEAVQDMFKQVLGGRGSSSRGGMLSIKMTYQAGSLPPMPRLPYREDLLRDLCCDNCGRSYGVYAVGLFCPDCGAPNLHVHFCREIDIVEREIAVARGSEECHGSEVAYRLLGNAHEDIVTASEAYQKVMYGYLRRARGLEPKTVTNDFQNIERARRRWAELGLDPFAFMDVDTFDAFDRFIQKRHIIGHNLGVADDKFCSLETDIEPGETVTVLADEIVQFARSCERLLEGLCAVVFQEPAVEKQANQTEQLGTGRS